MKRRPYIFLFIFLSFISLLGIRTAYTLIIYGATMLGDTNGNYEVTRDDAELLAAYILDGDVEGWDFLIDNADYNEDGVIKLNDALLIIQAAAYATATLDVSNPKGAFDYTESLSTNDTLVDGTFVAGGSFNLSVNHDDLDIGETYWVSSDTNVAIIDDAGNVNVVGAGSTTLMALFNNIVKTYTIDVYTANLSTSSFTVNVGKTADVSVSGFKDSSNSSVTIDDEYTVGASVDSNTYISTQVSNNTVTVTGVKGTTSAETLRVLINGATVGTIAVTVYDPSEVTNATVGFIPTQISSDFASNEAILFKSPDGQLALLDTAEKSSDICPYILDYIRSYAGVSGNTVATLKYLIISHSHGDHTGCLPYLIQSSQLRIQNIVIKNESAMTSFKDYNASTYANTTSYTNDSNGGALYNYVKAAKSSTTTLITVNSLDEGYTLTLGSGSKAIKFYLYNLKDVYSGVSKCWNGTSLASGKSIGFHAYSSGSNFSSMLQLGNGTYPYLEYANSTEIKYDTSFDTSSGSTDIGQTDPNTGGRMKFYAFVRGSNTYVCNANANSIAILAEVPIQDNDVRYLYFPSDLENNGYSHIGTYDVNHKVVLTSHGASYYYQYDTSTGKFVTDNDGKLVSDSSKMVYRAREYVTANSIKDKIGEDNLDKLIIYQASHHGMNVDKVSADVLNLNREDIYVITTSYGSMALPLDHYGVRPYYYTLDQVPKTGKTSQVGAPGIYYSGKYTFANNGFLQFFVQDDGSVKMSTTK